MKLFDGWKLLGADVRFLIGIGALSIALGIANNFRVYPEQRVRWPWQTAAEEDEGEINLSDNAGSDASPVAEEPVQPGEEASVEDAADEKAPVVSAAPTVEVRPGVWTGDFASAIASARAAHRPLLIFGAATKCTHCAQMKTAVYNAPFLKWAGSAGLYLVHATYRDARPVADQPPAIRFLEEELKPTDRAGSPYMGIYWPRGEGGELRLAFAGRRGHMSGGDGGTLTAVLVRTLEKELAEYLTTVKGRISLQEAVSSTAVVVKPAIRGRGTVRMSPEDGRITDGKTVTLKAVPERGAKFVKWIRPNGKTYYILDKNNRPRTVKIQYGHHRGTWTAVFSD